MNRKASLIMLAALLAALSIASAVHAESVPLLSLRGTSLGIGPDYEWTGSATSQLGDLDGQWTVGIRGAKVLFDGEDSETLFGSTAFTAGAVYGIRTEDMRYSVGFRWRIWNRR